MLRLECLTVICVLVILGARESCTASPLLRRGKDEKDAPSIYDCLQAASGGEECRSSFDGQCVWCAEPVYGLCVTPKVADMIGVLPFFTCDPHAAAVFDSTKEETKAAEAW
ncbi:expressed unknown protein [Seminavis robusta]|uniref:Uncharacterized protein n=1 Tax=Seminavis robusta TaxID=568900 RepID=A0A9N8EVW1_9STRA|nr:expressed unknown protein [Seminavis robusta]|eukprot:Sro2407_g326590.1 n/a (111) ;mRNA; f:12335-12667